jgi:hypothetical protein
MNMQIMPLSTKVNYQPQNQNYAQKKVNFGNLQIVKWKFEPNETFVLGQIARECSTRLDDKGVLKFGCANHKRYAQDILRRAQIPFIDLTRPLDMLCKLGSS